jgi:hypothetical protein
MPVTIKTDKGHYGLTGWVKDQSVALQFFDKPAAEFLAKDKKLENYEIVPIAWKPDVGHSTADPFGYRGRKHG